MWDRARIELATPGSAVRHITDCATWSGIVNNMAQDQKILFLRIEKQLSHVFDPLKYKLDFSSWIEPVHVVMCMYFALNIKCYTQRHKTKVGFSPATS